MQLEAITNSSDDNTAEFSRTNTASFRVLSACGTSYLLQWLLLRLSIRFGAAWHHSPSVKSSEEKYFYSHRSLVLPNCTFMLCVPATAPFTCQVRQYSIRGMYSLEEEDEDYLARSRFMQTILVYRPVPLLVTVQFICNFPCHMA